MIHAQQSLAQDCFDTMTSHEKREHSVIIDVELAQEILCGLARKLTNPDYHALIVGHYESFNVMGNALRELTKESREALSDRKVA